MVQKLFATQQTTVVLVAGVTAVISILGSFIYQKLKPKKVPTEWKPVGKIKKMCIYPLKGGKRSEPPRVECSERGLMETEKFDKSFRLRDRSFLVYHVESREYRTCMNYPKMVLVEIQAHDENSVVVNAPNMRKLIVKVPNRKKDKEVIVKFYKDEPVSVIDCGDEAAVWISNYFLEKDSGLRLSFNDGCKKRTHMPTVFKYLEDYYQRGITTDSAGLNSDIAAVMMISQTSVDDVNSRLEEKVSGDCFRSNMLVEDQNLEAFEEDSWEWVKVGNVVMKNIAECVRCVNTTVDTETGVRRADREPLKTMRQYRMSESPAKDPVMGIYLEVHKTGNISIGDTVYVGKL
ncbi:hypothetical protein JTB14_031137 [Gonioctena quinquepunctata]|nr:hypothetical protein JTB14_031137 [Gonioctena quinquepunctata]